jgi:hypothetical protein
MSLKINRPTAMNIFHPLYPPPAGESRFNLITPQAFNVNNSVVARDSSVALLLRNDIAPHRTKRGGGHHVWSKFADSSARRLFPLLRMLAGHSDRSAAKGGISNNEQCKPITYKNINRWNIFNSYSASGTAQWGKKKEKKKNKQKI